MKDKDKLKNLALVENISSRHNNNELRLKSTGEKERKVSHWPNTILFISIVKQEIKVVMPRRLPRDKGKNPAA